MCHTRRCKYECRLGLCMAKADRKPDDALCMMEDPNEKAVEETKPARGQRGRKAA